jgi:ribosomal protein L16 Arg81 hydroxylase
MIAPVTVSEFFESYFEQKPLLVARDKPDYFQELLTLQDVDRALTILHPSSGEIDLVRRDTPERIKIEEYTAPSGFADPARVANLFAAGATVIFLSLNRRLPKLAELCAGLEAKFTQPVQANVYLTPPENQGFEVHYDSHDVFVIQAAGSKVWNFYRAPIELPLPTQSFVRSEYDPGPVTRSFEMKAGDVLYVPRGLMHDARSTDKTSLHVTIGVLSYTWTDLMIDAITAMSLDDAAFRKSLPAGFARMDFDRRDARAYFGGLLRGLIEESQFDALLDDFADHFVGTREVPLPGQLEAMDPANKPCMLDVFSPRPHLVYRLTNAAEPGRIKLRARGIELTLPSTVEAAVRFALETTSYRAIDLPIALSAEEKLTLIARLLREGLVKRAVSRS